MAVIAIDWAIGLFEGEGSIVFSRKQAHLSLQMTDRDIVKRFHKTVRLGTFRGPYKYKHKPTWVWSCTRGEDVAFLLTEWLPYLGKRRARMARKAIKIATLSSEYRFRFLSACKKGHKWTDETTYLNKRRGIRRCRTCHNAKARKRGALLRSLR